MKKVTKPRKGKPIFSIYNEQDWGWAERRIGVNKPISQPKTLDNLEVGDVRKVRVINQYDIDDSRLTVWAYDNMQVKPTLRDGGEILEILITNSKKCPTCGK